MVAASSYTDVLTILQFIKSPYIESVSKIVFILIVQLIGKEFYRTELLLMQKSRCL